MTIDQVGDGSFQKRLNNNQCPRCLCKLKDMGRYRKCDVCNLIINGARDDSRKRHSTTKEK